MSEVRECALDTPITPITVFSCHTHYQRFDLSSCSWSSGRPPATAIIFLSDQFSMPGQQSLPRDDGSHFLQQSVSQGFGLDGQSPPLIIVELQPPVAQLLPQNTVLLTQIIDDLVLAMIHPARR